MTAEENYRLVREIEKNRDFLLQAYQQNPNLLALAEPRVRLLFGHTSVDALVQPCTNECDQADMAATPYFKP